MLSAAQGGNTIAFTYDALGRQLTQTIPIPMIANPVFTSEWDLAGRRTRYIWPVDASGPTAYYVDYDYLVTGEMTAVREKGATSGAGVLASFGYDDLGRRTSLARGNGAATTYGYDAVSRLGSMTHDFGGAAVTHDLILGFAYNPASQIVSSTRSNDLYAWTGHGSGTTSSSANGLNQLAGHGGATPTHDARGNLTSDGTFAYTYSSENLMTSGANSGALDYDPLMRFYKNFSTYFVHEGGQLIGDYYNGNIVGRYIPGPGIDEALVQVTKTGARTWFHADERGSIIAGSDAAGANSRIVLFDEYGKRGPGGSYRFAFTGQVHLLNDIYDYKARNYNARLGRFLQPDPIGYGDGMNIYAYVGGDPVNFGDPSGLCKDGNGKSVGAPTGSRICGGHGAASVYGGIASHLSGSTTAGPGGAGAGSGGKDISSNPAKEFKDAAIDLRLPIQLADATGWARVLEGAQTAGKWTVRGAGAIATGACFLLSGACGLEEQRMSLYRIVNATELNVIKTTGTYGFNPNSSGKYFGFSKTQTENLFNTLYRNGGSLTHTSVPMQIIYQGTEVYDPGGAGPSIHFSDPTLPMVYKSMTPIRVIYTR